METTLSGGHVLETPMTCLTMSLPVSCYKQVLILYLLIKETELMSMVQYSLSD